MASALHTVSLSALAGRQLQALIDYITTQGSPQAAVQEAARVLEAIAQLEHAPRIGRPSPNGTRELVTARPYVIRYRVTGRRVTVIRIRHGARRPTD